MRRFLPSISNESQKIEGTRQRSALRSVLAHVPARGLARDLARDLARVLARGPVPVPAAASASASGAGGTASCAAGHGDTRQRDRLAGVWLGAPPVVSPRQLDAGGGSTRRRE